MFIYVTDTNRYTWAINVDRVVKISEHNYITLIHLTDGDTIKTDERMLDLVPRMNNS